LAQKSNIQKDSPVKGLPPKKRPLTLQAMGKKLIDGNGL